MMGLKRHLARFLRDEEGQTTTEYIVILAIVVMIAMKFKSTFTGEGGVMDRVLGSVGSQIENNLLNQ